jgi:zinc protease
VSRRLLLAATALLLPAPLAAQSFPPAPAIAPVKPFTIPATETYTLANGMKVTLIPWGVAPKTFVTLNVFAGNLNEDKQTWLADLTAAMLKEGAGGRSSTELARAAASLGGDIATGSDEASTTISTDVLSENAAAAVALVGDVALRPALPAGEFARVQANLGRRLAQAYAQPGVIADYALARAYYGDHPYGRVLPTPAAFSAYTLADVQRFYRTQFGAKRAHLYIAGRFDAAAVKAAVEKSFGGWAAGPERLSLPPRPQPGPRVLLVDRPGAPQSTLRLAFAGPAPGSPNDIAFRTANSLLGGAFNSRITTNIRENKGYTYSPFSGITLHPGESRWTFNGDVTTAVTGPALTEIFSEVRRLADTPPNTAEWEGTRTYRVGIFTLGQSTAPGLIGLLSTIEELGLPADWPNRYVPAVMAVTPAQFSGVVKEHLPLNRMTLVVVGDLKTVTPQLQALPELKGATFQTVTVP